MLTDWIYWLYSIPQIDLLLLLCPLMLFDSARYVIAALAMWLVDAAHDAYAWLRGHNDVPSYSHCPSVCAVIAGLNEADGLERSLSNIWGCYPRLEIVIVDDGSTDGMSEVANRFAKCHQGVKVITKKRGGKSSAMNAALPLTNAEVIVIVDADSGLSRDAIWEVVQPLSDPRVAAVSGNVMVRNTGRNLLTYLQTFEYLRSILVGRLFSGRMGILGIVSGAFGAFRRSALDRVGAWDVGPGEDEDIVLRLRKLGYRIEFAPRAECYTDVPESLKVLIKQRRRWEWAVVTFEARKHIDLADPRYANFRVSNLLLMMERWVFNLILPIFFWVYILWLALNIEAGYMLQISAMYYFVYIFLEAIQWLMVLYYSEHKWRDAKLVFALPLLPFYQFMQRCVTTRALLEEMLLRQSFKDGFVPSHVRMATRKW
ncbi:MAG: glycosyltransferase family 2 protein [Pirellulales bacterium]